ncbi:MAG TPA: rRNA maturation RNase YbeY [Longimicrobiales bacterium]|nr:rRNA maturation RNase YbeY [Longimicrobiales bacterium]
MGVRVRIQPSDGARALLARADVALPRVPMRAGVRRALHAAGRRDGEFSIALLDDDEIAALNAEYLGHRAATDVIAFALYEPPEPPLGDIYIGAAQALRQARARRIAPAEELTRLAVHGTLHVLGHDHPEGDARMQSDMWRLQEAIVLEVTS